MSWLYSRVLVEEYLGENFSDGEQSAPLNGNPTPQAYCSPDKMMEVSRLSRFGMTFKPLTADRGEELLMLFREGFHAKTLVQPEKAPELMENEAGCGEKWRGSFAKYDPDSSLWRTHQCSLLGGLDEFSETWPQWGLMRDGECWEQQMLEQTIRGTEFGLKEKQECLIVKNVDGNLKLGVLQDLDALNVEQHNQKLLKWPTPRSCSAMAATITDKGKRFPNLETVMAHMDKATIGGKLNPTWVKWLMGWPLGWTDLKPLEMDKSHCVQQPHGES